MIMIISETTMVSGLFSLFKSVFNQGLRNQNVLL